MISEYGIEHTFKTGENIIEFTPTRSGIFYYYCWMGMIRGEIRDFTPKLLQENLLSVVKFISGGDYVNSFEIALLQIDTQSNKEANLERISVMIDEAASKGANFITLPEFANYIGDRSGVYENAELIPEGITSALYSEKAKKYGMWIHGGSICERIPGDDKHVYNTSLVFNPTGELIAQYRKIHLYDIESYHESDSVKAGAQIVNFDTDFGNMGLSICYDIRFPEIYRVMAVNGAKLIFVPAQFNLYTGKDHWEVLLRARAIENTCYIVAPDQIGKKHNMQSYSRSMVIDPWGNVIAQASDKECIVFANIDMDYLDTVRNKMPSLLHRRPEFYGA